MRNYSRLQRIKWKIKYFIRYIKYALKRQKPMTLRRTTYRMIIEGKHPPYEPESYYWQEEIPVTNKEIIRTLSASRWFLKNALMNRIKNPTPEVEKYWKNKQLRRKLESV
jgi:hypothetical protein